MRVAHLLVDDVMHVADDDSASVITTVYEFGGERWLTAHRGTQGDPLGPMKVLDTKQNRLDMPTVSMHSLGTRPLPVRHGEISFKDTWSIEGASVYALIIPDGFIAMQIEIDKQGDSALPQIERGVDNDGRLFYWALFGGSGPSTFRIEARLKSDPAKVAEQTADVDVVKGRRKFSALVRVIPTNTRSLQLLLSLLQFGSRFVR